MHTRTRLNRRQFQAFGGAAFASLAARPFAAHASDVLPYGQYDAIGLAELVKAGEVTPTELLKEAISRTESVNDEINAVVIKMYDEAYALIEEGIPDGPFRGVPFLLKDIGAMYGGVRYTAGSRLLADFIAPADSELVRRYKQAGLVIFGRTNTPEFGLNGSTEPELFGATKNPWNPSHSSGGSSGGSAAAVASRVVPITQGGDGGGSIRIPASCCGVFGMKPSRGRIPMGPGVGEVWEGLVTMHTLSLSVRDNAAMLDATAGPDVGAPYHIAPPDKTFLSATKEPPKNPLRIAWTTECVTDRIHPDCKAAVEDAAKLCEHLGHHVERDGPEIDYKEAEDAFVMTVRVHAAGMLDALGEQLGRKVTADSVEAATWSAAEIGWSTSAAEFARNKSRINKATRELGRFFSRYDVLLTPTLASPPPVLGFLDTLGLPYEEFNRRLLDFTPFTWIHNVAGTPAISVPLHWNKQDLPIGVQFATRLGEESTLYSLAGQLERERPWRSRIPALSAK